MGKEWTISEVKAGANVDWFEDTVVPDAPKAVRELAEAQVATSNVLWASTMALAFSGNFTGGPPRDPNLRKTLEADMGGPHWYSYRSDEGWVKYDRFDPIGVIIATSAHAAVMGKAAWNLHGQYQQGDPSDEIFEKYKEVLNAGVVSYSASIYYAKIKYFLEQNFKFDELIVYIDVGDIENEALADRLKISKKYDTDKPKIRYSKSVAFLKKNFFISYTVLNFINDRTYYYLNSLKNYDEKKEDEFILSIVSGETYKTDIWTINKELYNK